MVYIELTESNQVTIGSSGNDSIFGTLGQDTIDGKAGDDVLVGNSGNDYLLGRGGNDNLQGGNGNDDLFGLAGNDIILGGNGNDLIQGGDGYDTLTGGGGADTFDLLYNDAKTGSYTTGAWFWKKTHYYTYFDDYDVIKDFNAAEGDQIVVYDFEMGSNIGAYSASVNGNNTELQFNGARFAVLEGVTNFDINNDLFISQG